MNLRNFLDQEVLVQFRGGFHLVVGNEHGQPTIAMTRAAPQQRSALVLPGDAPVGMAPLVVPIAQGKFVDIEGEIFFSYQPELEAPLRIDVQFHPDAIFSVSRVRDEKALPTVSPKSP